MKPFFKKNTFQNRKKFHHDGHFPWLFDILLRYTLYYLLWFPSHWLGTGKRKINATSNVVFSNKQSRPQTNRVKIMKPHANIFQRLYIEFRCFYDVFFSQLFPCSSATHTLFQWVFFQVQIMFGLKTKQDRKDKNKTLESKRKICIFGFKEILILACPLAPFRFASEMALFGNCQLSSKNVLEKRQPFS